MLRAQFFKLLCWWSLVWLLVAVLPRPLFAQVTMVQPMQPFRADNVQAYWEDGELIGLSVSAVVTGQNEAGQPVGYLQDGWTIDGADWLQALLQAAAVDEELNHNLFLAGFHTTETGLVTPMPNGSVVGGTNPGLIGYDPEFHYFLRQIGDEYASYDLFVNNEECGAQLYFYNAVTNPSFDGSSAPTGPFWSSAYTGNVGCTDVPVISAAIDNYEWFPEASAFFLPLEPGSGPSPFTDEGTPVTGVVGQSGRSAIAMFTTGMQDVADYATAMYEADAYEGYPEFTLYYGFFAGAPTGAVDEGDCEPGFCGGGGGTGGGDIEGYCAANPDAMICASTDVTEILEGEDDTVPGTDVTVELAEIEGFTIADDLGECPAAPSVMGPTGVIEFDNTKLCDTLIDIRPYMEMFGYVMSALILAKGLRA